ncbi:MAG: hypothetical protein HYV60_08685, partial [Planctomycetia bacterium]|nr:hypothetical protein [Planctomycetia bacterium]
MNKRKQKRTDEELGALVKAALGRQDAGGRGDSSPVSLASDRCRSLARSRLWCLKLDGQADSLLSGEGLRGTANAGPEAGGKSPQRLHFQVTAGDGGAYTLSFLDPLPPGIELLNITVAELQLARAPKDHSEFAQKLFWSDARLKEVRDFYKVSRPTSSSWQKESPAVYVGKCETPSVEFKFQLNIDELVITCPARVDQGRDFELAIVEFARTVAGYRIATRYSTRLEQSNERRKDELLSRFKLPVELGEDEVDITVRAPRPEELWRFGSHEISMLIGQAGDLIALPLTAGDGGFCFHISPNEHERLKQDNMTWALRVAPQEEE